MRKSFTYRLYPTQAQAAEMQRQLDVARELDNACLEERRDAYRRSGTTRTHYDQAAQLKEVRRLRPDVATVNFSLLQAVCRRVQRAFDAFFRRVKAGEKAGYPRFRSWQRWASITFPRYGDGCKLTGKTLYLQSVGQIKVKLHRPTEGVIKTVTLKRECGRWYAIFSSDLGDVQPAPSPRPATV